MPMLNLSKKLLIASLVSTITSCSNSAVTKEPSLIGTWKVETVQEQRILPKSMVTINFDSENNFFGTASCNNFTAKYNKDNNSLTIGTVVTTRKMCPPILMDQETKVLNTFKRIKRFQQTQNQLTMYDQKGTMQIEASLVE